ncbi:MAG: zinc-binding dehydrogenase [Anaerolineae bacterium]
MRAVRYHEYGEPEVLQPEEVSEPLPGSDEVLVRVQACGLNYLDVWCRTGLVKVPLPHIGGSEVAGEVAKLGNAVSGIEIGQQVAVYPWLFDNTCEYCMAGNQTTCLRGDVLGQMSEGGYAEFLKAPARNMIPLPEGMDHQSAAAVTLAALTAWHMLIGAAKIRSGEDVLVHAAGSGVGSAAIQIAKMVGCRVFTTASTGEKLEQATELGADTGINYTDSDFAQEIKRLTGKRGVDVVVEHVGADTFAKSVASLTRNGRLVTCGATTGSDARFNLRQLFVKQLELIGTYGGSRGELRQVLAATAQGRIRPVIDRIYPLEEAAEAHRRMEARGQFGKLILEV